ncbi:MAG: Malonyl-[acyl-carrier protein] O-methyltransferase [Gammaproteobacteria bacterium]|nr:Malonyl-[acyl-carrier protein] O-methyltransferase [Gammaproteobacteria bacterium]
MDINELDRRQVRRAFERAAGSYDEAAVVQRRMVDELIDRLGTIKIEPGRILDVGCGTGYARLSLMRRFPRSQYLGSDIAAGMLDQARPRAGRSRRNVEWVCGDIERLPLPDRSVDLVFCNAVLQWCDPGTAFAEMHRVLRTEGVLMFGTFGPDTLKELREAWAEVDSKPHVHEFLDMHHTGDALLNAGFELPVVDVDRVTVTHRSVMSCLRDLKAIGANNAAGGRARGLMPRRKLHDLGKAYAGRRNEDGLIETTYEIVYGHAWAGEFRPCRESDGAVSVPLSQIERRR